MQLKKWNKTAPSAMKYQVCINLKADFSTYSKQTKKHTKPKPKGISINNLDFPPVKYEVLANEI